MLAVQYDLEEITFENKMECGYVRNPFSSRPLRASTSEDAIHHISVVDKHLVGVYPISARQLPHGHGCLKTAAGKLVYSGKWHKGKTNFNNYPPLHLPSSLYAALLLV